MKFLSKILGLVLLSGTLFAQTTTTHKVPATDTANVFSNSNQFKLGVQAGPKSAAELPAIAAGNGTLIYCSDCQVQNACLTGGSGAWAQRVGGLWNCAGFGGSGGASGSQNYLVKFTTTSSLGNSSISDNGTLISTSENFSAGNGSFANGTFSGTLGVTGASTLGDVSSSGAVDWSGASLVKTKVSPGYAPTASGSMGYDSTANAYVGGVNGVSKFFATKDIAGGGTNATSFSTNGTVTFDGTKLSSTVGGAGTLCWQETDGGVPFFGACAGSASTSWSALSAPSANLTLHNTTRTTLFDWTDTTSNVPLTYTFGAVSGSPTNAQFLIQDTTGSTSIGNVVHIRTQGTSTSNGLKVQTPSGGGTPLIVDAGSDSATAINVIHGKVSMTGTGTPSIEGTFAADPSAPAGTKSGIYYGSTGLIKGSYAGDALSPFARQSDIGGTWTGKTLTALPAGVIPDLSGTYVQQTQIGNSTAGVAGLDGSAQLLATNLSAVALGTSSVNFNIGESASAFTPFTISDTCTTCASADTSYNFAVKTGSNSWHNPLDIEVNGTKQLQVCKLTGPQGTVVIGSAVACSALPTGPTTFSKFVVQSQTAGHTVQRLYQGSNAATGVMHELNNVTASGTGWYYEKFCAGATGSNTACGSGTVNASLRGDGLFTTSSISTAALTLSSITGSTQCLHVDTNGVVTGTGSDCSSVSSTPRLDQVTDPNTTKTFLLGNNPLLFNTATTTNSQNAVTFGETTAATGTSDVLVQLLTATGSTAVPFKITQAAGPSGAAAPNAVTVTGGTGGAAANATANGNTGAAVSVTSGAGSAGGATSGNGGAGGDVTLTAGNGGNVTSGTNGSGGNINLNPGAAGTGGSGGASGKVIVGGTLTNASGTFTISPTGTNGLQLTTTSGNLVLTTGLQAKAGWINKYNSIVTVYDGLPYLVAKTDLTAQSAAITPTTLYATPASGVSTQYKVCFNSKVTTAATTSSTLGGAGGFQVIYTDADDSVVVTTPSGIAYNSSSSTLTLNTTQAVMSGCIPINAKASTNIQYQMGYTSSGATAMQYNLHVWVENE